MAMKVQVFLFHMDEKWFMSLVLRMFGKIAPVFGCRGVWNRIHHKNNIDKLLAICAAGIAPHDNDLRKGGTAYKICLTRCGGMVAAQKDSYKRVYKSDGTWHYPKIAANLLRRKGQEYFENMEITGSNEGGEGKKGKFALTKWAKDDFMPPLLDIVQKIGHETGKRVHVRGQMDNAGPHVEKHFRRLIVDLFGEYGWEWTYQPSNSQVAAAVHDCNGGDDFVKEHKGLSFNVRRVCRPFYGDDIESGDDALDLTSLAPRDLMEAKGVVVEEFDDGVDVDGAEARDLTDTSRRLRYGVPDVREHSIGDHLSFAALHMIMGDPDMDPDDLNEEQKERLSAFAEAYYAKCDAGETG